MQEADGLANFVALLAKQGQGFKLALARRINLTQWQPRHRQRRQGGRDVLGFAETSTQIQAGIEHGQCIFKIALAFGQCSPDIKGVRLRLVRGLDGGQLHG